MRIKPNPEEYKIMYLAASRVCSLHDITFSEFKSKSRKRKFIEPRQVFYLFIKKYYPFISLCKIGNFTGGRDHTTVLNGLGNIKDDIEIYEREALKIKAYLSEMRMTVQGKNNLLPCNQVAVKNIAPKPTLLFY